MKLSSKTQALYDLIAPAVAACDVELWGVEFIPQGKRSLLRIYIDRPGSAPSDDHATTTAEGEDGGRGVGVEDCVRVTQQVGAILDVHDPIAGEYALEVSSPGWDRPFFSIDQMQRYIGQQVALRLITALANRRRMQGRLVTVNRDTQQIQLEVEQQLIEVDTHNIDKAHLVYQD